MFFSDPCGISVFDCRNLNFWTSTSLAVFAKMGLRLQCSNITRDVTYSVVSYLISMFCKNSCRMNLFFCFLLVFLFGWGGVVFLCFSLLIIFVRFYFIFLLYYNSYMFVACYLYVFHRIQLSDLGAEEDDWNVRRLR